MKKNKLYWAVGTALGAFCITSPGVAQQATPQAAEASSGGLEEIVVTARRRAESLINVPVSVSALGSDDIQRYSAASLQQISQMVPSLTITTAATGSGASLSIRGIGSVAEDPGVDQSVSVYTDSVPIGRGRIIGVAQFDIQQVEVLKGPQALFFGKNSPAGVVSLTSAGPGNHFEARAVAGYEFNAKEKYIEVAAGGPITETLGVRLALRGEKMSGFIKNIARPLLDPLTGLMTPGAAHKNSPFSTKLAGRLTVKYQPSDDLTITGKFFAAHAKIDDPTGQIEHICPSGVLTVAGVPIVGEDCKVNGVHLNTGINPALAANWPHANNGKLYGKLSIQTGSLNINYGSGPITLTSVTSYTHLKNRDLFNASVSSVEALIPQSNEITHIFTQELRLNSDYDGPLNFTAGGFYEHQKRDAPNAVALLFLGPDNRTGVARNWTFTREAANKSNSISAFGQARWNIVEELELAGGVRYTRDTKKAAVSNSFVNPNAIAVFGPAFFLAEGVVLGDKKSFSNWSPEATLTWHPTQGQTAYIAYKTGYKSGGFSNTLLLGGGFNIGNLTYKPETTKGGEIGYKAKLFDNRVRIEAAVYRYKFSNLQLSAFDAATFSYFIKNAASARTTGFEINTQWKATDGLTLRGEVDYNRARYLDFPGAQCYQTQTPAQGCAANGTQNLGGKPLSRAPKWNIAPGFTFETPIGDDLTLGIDGDAHYKSKFYTDGAGSPAVIQKGLWLLNGAARLTSTKMGATLSLIGRNLTNKHWFQYSSDSALQGTPTWSPLTERGRQIALQVSANF